MSTSIEAAPPDTVTSGANILNATPTETQPRLQSQSEVLTQSEVTPDSSGAGARSNLLVSTGSENSKGFMVDGKLINTENWAVVSKAATRRYDIVKERVDRHDFDRAALNIGPKFHLVDAKYQELKKYLKSRDKEIEINRYRLTPQQKSEQNVHRKRASYHVVINKKSQKDRIQTPQRSTQRDNAEKGSGKRQLDMNNGAKKKSGLKVTKKK